MIIPTRAARFLFFSLLVSSFYAFANLSSPNPNHQCRNDDGNSQECQPGYADRELTDRPNEDEDCVDNDNRCAAWAEEGECTANPGYMLESCRKSCLVCGVDDYATLELIESSSCNDELEDCERLAAEGMCEKSPLPVMVSCRRSCSACLSNIKSTVDFGVKQDIPEGRKGVVTKAIVRLSIKYMQKVVSDPLYSSVRHVCRNEHESCSWWASIGECRDNAGYMQTNCAPACRSCETVEFMRKCPLDPDAEEALKPGDLDKMFGKIIREEEYAQLQPVIHSRPFANVHPLDADDVQVGPWVISFENFMSKEECDRLISHGHREKFRRSADVGSVNPDGTHGSKVSDQRTSNNAWCHERCHNDPIVKRVQQRIANVTGVPRRNSEELQLLRYEPGQYYVVHHDYIPHHKWRQPGVRILTFFLYLNDVEEGGGTRFPLLRNLTITPKKGKALLWPSVRNQDPHEKDPRTEHEALPVEKGIKYGANAWLHMREWRTAFDIKCAD